MKFSEHDKMILSGKVAKPTFRGERHPYERGWQEESSQDEHQARSA